MHTKQSDEKQMLLRNNGSVKLLTEEWVWVWGRWVEGAGEMKSSANYIKAKIQGSESPHNEQAQRNIL